VDCRPRLDGCAHLASGALAAAAAGEELIDDEAAGSVGRDTAAR
jgi:hypothetical protein